MIYDANVGGSGVAGKLRWDDGFCFMSNDGAWKCGCCFLFKSAVASRHQIPSLRWHLPKIVDLEWLRQLNDQKFVSSTTGVCLCQQGCAKR